MSPEPKAIFSPTAERPSAPKRMGLAGVIKDAFSLTTLLLFGSLLQGFFILIFPSARYALLPAILLLGRAAILTTRDLALSSQTYASKRGVVPGYMAAHLPAPTYNPSSTTPSPFSGLPASKGVVVFHLGARYNHPLGPLAPGGSEFAQHFLSLHKALLERTARHGCLGGSVWRADDAAATNSVLAVYYFRDVEGLHRFATDAAHRAAMEWYTGKFAGKDGRKHIGIYHEIFWAPPGGYNTAFLNMSPLLMTAGASRVRNEATGEEEWVGTAVEAETPLWREQFAQMRRDVKAMEGMVAGSEKAGC